MTDQEIEKLREKLGGDYFVKRQNGAITVELVDIWKGVEFAECVGNNGYSDSWTIGKIYPVEKVSNSKILLYDNLREYCPVIDFDYRHHPELVCFKPSTESAYVEQLKAKAKELYGEIKDGDKFLREYCIQKPISIIRNGYDPAFKYRKDLDSLIFQGTGIYKQGKWAKKVEDEISNRVSVDPINCSISTPDYRINAFDQSFEPQEMSFLFSVQGIVVGIKHTKEIANYLAKCLEDYLNKSQ